MPNRPIPRRGAMGETPLIHPVPRPLPLTRTVRTRTREAPDMRDHPQPDHRAAIPQDHSGSAPGPDGRGQTHVMGSDVTRPQIAAVSLLTLLALIAGLLWSANYANLTL